jgi:hypothetical protein
MNKSKCRRRPFFDGCCCFCCIHTGKEKDDEYARGPLVARPPKASTTPTLYMLATDIIVTPINLIVIRLRDEEEREELIPTLFRSNKKSVVQYRSVPDYSPTKYAYFAIGT